MKIATFLNQEEGLVHLTRMVHFLEIQVLQLEKIGHL